MLPDGGPVRRHYPSVKDFSGNPKQGTPRMWQECTEKLRLPGSICIHIIFLLYLRGSL